MRLKDLIEDSIKIGLNKKLLLINTGIDEKSFDKKLIDDNFNSTESKKLLRTIKDWRKANAIF